MKQLLRGWVLAISVGAFALSALPVRAGDDIPWQHYGADRFSSRYSPADLITKDNVKDLKVVWKFNLADADARQSKPTEKSRNLVSTPLMVNGRIYFTTGNNMVVCVKPDTGEIIWTFDPEAYNQARAPHGGLRSRGVEYWTDGTEERILLASGGMQLFALDPKTGAKIPGFGEEEGGFTDLAKHFDREFVRTNITVNAPPIVCRDTIIVGSVVNDFGSTKAMPPGDVRGYDVRTGKFKWIFHTVPQEGEFGVETWEEESWKYTGSTNVWTMMSADEELGYVYLPLSTPTDDHYGGHRPGDNLFAECLVALDAATGKRVWHYQAVHHGIWDYDFPAAPNLLDVTVDGKKVKAIAAVTKHAFTYVLDRVTGIPVWPIEEKAVPQSRTPGEKSAATQPFPTKPPPFDLQGITEDTVIDLTPELKAEALEIIKAYETGPLFTPPIPAGFEGKKGLIQLPGMTGGANWPGAAVDPETGILYVISYTRPMVMALREGGSRSDLTYNRGGGGNVEGPQGLPITKPPWGRVTALDLNKGDIAWQVPLGDSYRNHPIIQQLNPGPLGSSYSSGLAGAGTLVTKTLVFSNPAVEAKQGGGGNLVAYDKATGAIVAQVRLENTPVAPPMTYVYQGKQYILFCSELGRTDKEVVALGLP